MLHTRDRDDAVVRVLDAEMRVRSRRKKWSMERSDIGFHERWLVLLPEAAVVRGINHTT